MNYLILLSNSGHYVCTNDGRKVYPATGTRTRGECESWVETQKAMEVTEDPVGYPHDFDEAEMLVNRIEGDIMTLAKLCPNHWLVTKINGKPHAREENFDNLTLNKREEFKRDQQWLPRWLRKQAD